MAAAAGAASVSTRGATTGVLLAIGAALGFGMKAIFVKLAYPYGVTPVTLLALRMALAAPVFVWVGVRASGGAVTVRTFAAVAVCGVLGYYASSLLDFIGLQYISAGLERLILFTYPTLTVIGGVALHRQPITARMVRALALTYAGIGLAFAHDLHSFGAMADVWLGAGFVFASALTYASYLLGSGALIVRLGTARFTAWAMLISTAATFAHFAATQSTEVLFGLRWQVYAYAGAMALFSTVLPVFMQSAAIRRMGSGRAAVIGTVGPLLTIFLGWTVLGEPWSIWQIVGAGLVLAGVWQIGRR